LSYNFDSRNARKPIKLSTDSDYSLVSKKNLSQKMARYGGAPGPGKLGQKEKTYPNSDVIHKGNEIRNLIFFWNLN